MARLIPEKVAPHYPATLNTIEDYQRSSDMGMKAYYWTDDNGRRIRVHEKSSVELRFWSKVNKDGPIHSTLQTNCWEWVGSRTQGYGKLTCKQLKTQHTHRISWILHHGSIPNEMWVLHKCDNRLCVNPEHLFLGNHDSNMEDMARKGRSGRAVLTWEQVREIRRRYRPGNGRGRYGSNSGELGREFGVTATAIRLIIQGRNYRHLDNG